jgi:anaerobic selenocysteine-containing dehydrogenase
MSTTDTAVNDGELVRLRPDPDHPLSRGEACPKGIAMTQVQNDPDRVLRPLRRRADGSGFDEVDWDTAISDIGQRLRALIEERGPSSVAWYEGNTAHFSYSHFLWTKGFLDGLGTPHFYSALSQDANNLFASSAIVYGTPLNVPFPDLARTRFLLMLGANPLVSHGSAVSAPRVREQLLDITRRGGRVVVVDPRRTETARLFEHVPIQPDTDVLLLAALLQVVFAEGLTDRAFVDAHCQGAGELARDVAPYTPEAVADRTRIPADTIRELARELARGRAVVYGRSGTCLGRFATLTHCLLNALNAVTGNLDRPGGSVFGVAPLPIDLLGPATGLASFGTRRSPIGDFPDVVGTLPAATMARAITTPGPDQVRALFVGGGNPVSSVPNSDELEAALGDLDLLVSLDLYVTETNRHADYVLPATTFLERDDTAAMVSLAWFTTPFFQYTDAVLEPRARALARPPRDPLLPQGAARHRRADRPVRRPVRSATRRAQPPHAPARTAWPGARRARPHRAPAQEDPTQGPPGRARRTRRARGARTAGVRARRGRPGPAAAHDRAAGAALAQLVDAQRPQADERSSRPHAARAPTGRGRPRPRGGPGRRRHVAHRDDHPPGPRHRRDDPGDGRRAARVGSSRRLDDRRRRGRRHLEPAHPVGRRRA